MIRKPAVANQFYPGREKDLKEDIAGRIAEGQKREIGRASCRERV